MTSPSRVAEMAARKSYGRLLALLSKRTRDIAQAEDALADAFAKALKVWPDIGVPYNPEAWLLTVARNRLTDALRRQSRWESSEEQEYDMISISKEPQTDFLDERLSLMMVCAHPAIDTNLHAPMMLQTVLGLSTASIAKLFLDSPTALAKRLVRAKAKIRENRIPFEIPEPTTLPERSQAIASAIYALHAHDWLEPSDTYGREALFLADLACRLLPEDPEMMGLAALIAFGHARVNARTVSGVLVPTAEQDMTRWNPALIEYGRIKLLSAAKQNQIGRFQLEAAIEEVHINRLASGKTDWKALDQLYRGLLQISPSIGAAVAHAIVVAELDGPHIGLKMLDEIEEEKCSAFQPFWAARAALFGRLSDTIQAVLAYEKAIELAEDRTVIQYLRKAKGEIECRTG